MPKPVLKEPAPMPKPVLVAPLPQPLVVIPKDEYAKCETEASKKQFLGNYLYQFVVRLIESKKDLNESDSLAGKVTGMILDG